MGKYNFDRYIERRGTDSSKWDGFESRFPGYNASGALPMWVADMDFTAPDEVIDVLKKKAAFGIYGYPAPKGKSFDDAFIRWVKKRHDLDMMAESLVITQGVVPAITYAVQAFANEGDGVLIQPPVYYPFKDRCITYNKRKAVESPLIEKDGSYTIDFEDFERKARDENTKLFILCSPHNPTGRVFTKEELTAMGDLCVKHGVKVVSDEIHNDFVFQGEHTVFASVKKEYEEISVICTSPSKTFNLASMLISNIFIPNRELRQRFRHEVDAAGISQLSVLGLVAAKAAYGQGDKWYEQMMSYVGENIRYVKEYVKENLPGVTVIDGEGTYLLWLDFRGCGLGPEELDHRIIYEAKLWLDSGKIFGGTGAGFQRINVAAPRAILTECLERIRKIL